MKGILIKIAITCAGHHHFGGIKDYGEKKGALVTIVPNCRPNCPRPRLHLRKI